MDEFIKWFSELYQAGKEPNAAEQADWWVAHPLDDKKAYFYELQAAYEHLFGEPMGLMTGCIETYEDACDIMAACIRSGKPYEVDVPEGAII